MTYPLAPPVPGFGPVEPGSPITIKRRRFFETPGARKRPLLPHEAARAVRIE